jgi:hypothetical protein
MKNIFSFRLFGKPKIGNFSFCLKGKFILTRMLCFLNIYEILSLQNLILIYIKYFIITYRRKWLSFVKKNLIVEYLKIT